MTRRWVWIALVVVVVGALAWVAWPRGSESTEQRAERIASELRCVECEGLSVADAATSTAQATRDEIVERIEAGESDAEIRRAYVDRYGEGALMNPQSTGIDAVVWVLPVVVLALGAVGVGFVVVRTRRARRTSSDADEALVAAALRRSGTDRGADGDAVGTVPQGGSEAAGSVLDSGDATTLESEVDFLLRSIVDLDAEYAADGIDPETYATLHADYTARAAMALRALERGEAEPGVTGTDESAPDSDRSADVARDAMSTGRKALIVVVVAAFAVVAGVMVALAAGARLPGGLPSGDDAVVDTEQREDRLRQAVADNPDDPAAYLALASFLVAEGDVAGAIPLYDEASALDPTDPTGPTQVGWLLYLTATGTADTDQQATLLDGAKARLDAAVAIDPEYPDARFFRAVVALRGFGDAAAAVADLQRFLVLDPDNPMADDVRTLLEEAVAAADVDADPGAVPPQP